MAPRRDCALEAARTQGELSDLSSGLRSNVVPNYFPGSEKRNPKTEQLMNIVPV